MNNLYWQNVCAWVCAQSYSECMHCALPVRCVIPHAKSSLSIRVTRTRLPIKMRLQLFFRDVS